MNFFIFKKAIKAFRDKTHNFRNEIKFVKYLRLHINLLFIDVILSRSSIKDSSIKLLIIISKKFFVIFIDTFIKATSIEKIIYIYFIELKLFKMI